MEKIGKISTSKVSRWISLKLRTLLGPNISFFTNFGESCKSENFLIKSEFNFENWKFLLKFLLLGCHFLRNDFLLELQTVVGSNKARGVF